MTNDKSIRSLLGSILCAVLFFIFSKGCISDYVKGSNKNDIAHYEKMIRDSSVAMGVLASVYDETTIKIAGAPIKSYDFKFTYTVDGVKHTGNKTYTQLPETPLITLYYLKDDPSVYSLDPRAALITEKEKETSLKPLCWGIFFGIISLAAAYSVIQWFKKDPVTEQ